MALFAARFLFLPAPFLQLGSCLCWLADRRSLYSAFSSLVAALYSMLGTGRNQPIFAQWQYAAHDYFSLISACYFHVTSHDSLILLCCSLSKTFPVFLFTNQGLVFEGLSPEIFNGTYQDLQNKVTLSSLSGVPDCVK